MQNKIDRNDWLGSNFCFDLFYQKFSHRWMHSKGPIAFYFFGITNLKNGITVEGQTCGCSDMVWHYCSCHCHFNVCWAGTLGKGKNFKETEKWQNRTNTHSKQWFHRGPHHSVVIQCPKDRNPGTLRNAGSAIARNVKVTLSHKENVPKEYNSPSVIIMSNPLEKYWVQHKTHHSWLF